MLATVGYEHVVSTGFESTVTLCLDRDGLAQFGQTSSRRVALIFDITACLHRGFDDVLGGGKVRLASSKANHVFTFGLQCLGFCIHCKGG